MRVRIVAVGKIKDRGLRALLDDYYKRIGRHAKFEEVELKDGEDRVLVDRLKRQIPDRARVVALEVDGRRMSSRAFASFIERAGIEAVQTLVFLVGGAYGLPKSVSDAADLKLSLSAMTLPHRLARLMLAEQTYRAFSILAGEPYDH